MYISDIQAFIICESVAFVKEYISETWGEGLYRELCTFQIEQGRHEDFESEIQMRKEEKVVGRSDQLHLQFEEIDEDGFVINKDEDFAN